MWTPYKGRAKTMIYTNTHTFTYKNDLLNSFNHMFNHMALEPRCGALRPGALQLGRAQTGYLSILSIPWTAFCSQSSSYYSFSCTYRSTILRSTSSDCKIISGQLDELFPKIYIFSWFTQVVEHVKHFKLISTIFFWVSRAMKSKVSFTKSIFCISRELNSFGNLLFANRFSTLLIGFSTQGERMRSGFGSR